MRPSFPSLTVALLAGLCASAGAQQSAPADAPKQALPQRWQAADSNHDGALDKAEAEAGLPQLARNFDRLDANGDGRLVPGEMGQSVLDTWHQADADGDGLLDKEEARKAGMTRVVRAFGRLDADDDGKLSPQELQSVAERLRGRRRQ